MFFFACNQSPPAKDKIKLDPIEMEAVKKCDSLIARFYTRCQISDCSKIDLVKIENEFIEIKKRSYVEAYNFLKRKYDISFP